MAFLLLNPVLILLVSLCLTISFTYAADKTKNGAVIHNNPQSTRDILPGKIWTPKERAKAKPADWGEARSKEAPKEKAMPSTEPQGSAPSGKPNRNANKDAKHAFPKEWKVIEKNELLDTDNPPAGHEGAADMTRGTPNIYTPYGVNYHAEMWKDFPWKAIGKLYFNTEGGGSGYCTAQVISPKNIIVTAAHCLYDRGAGKWHKDFAFVPAERNNSTPFGIFGWTSAAILTNYISNGGRRYDVGVINLINNDKGKSVTYYTGWLGRSWNYPYKQLLHAVGYASNLSTVYTNLCAAESFDADCEGTDVLVMGCNMTYGSSGGGWIMAYKPYESGSNNQVNSVVSGPSCAGDFGQTFVGSHFSSDNIVLLCNAAGC